MITVPVISKIFIIKNKRCKINNSLNFQKKIVNSISHYSKSAYFNKYSEGLFQF